MPRAHALLSVHDSNLLDLHSGDEVAVLPTAADRLDRPAIYAADAVHAAQETCHREIVCSVTQCAAFKWLSDALSKGITMQQ